MIKIEVREPLNVTNTANAYGGGTYVNGGSVPLAGAGVTTTGIGVFAIDAAGSTSGSGLLPSLALNGGGTVNFALPASTTNPPIVVTGNLAANGGTVLNVTGSATAGSQYQLISYGGTPLTTAQFASLELGATPGGGLLYGLVNNTGSNSVDIAAQAVTTNIFTWTGAVNNSWDTSTLNFGANPYSDGSKVIFNDSANTASTGPTPIVISGGTVQPQTVVVNNSAVNYTISNVIAGSLAGGLSKGGTGNLTLSGANTFSGATVVTGGTLEAVVTNTANGLGASAVTLGNGTTLQLDATATTTAPGLTGRIIGNTAQHSRMMWRVCRTTLPRP